MGIVVAKHQQEVRQACKRGARCRERSAAHLYAEAHPLDEDYASACATTKGVEAEPLTLKVLFDWTDADGSGKLSREELEGSLGVIKKICGGFLPTITDEAWHHLDEDGNGVLNFSEFAAWAGPRLGLPLGMAKMIARAGTTSMSSPCSVIGCPCEAFKGKTEKGDGEKCKDCKHKCGLHVSRTSRTAEVPYPDYWTNHDGTFNSMIPLVSSASEEFQQLVDKTYNWKFTKDRKVHNPTCAMVPKKFQVVQVYRNENDANWMEYGCRRAEVMNRVQEAERDGGKPIVMYDDIKSMVAWRDIGGAKADRLSHECNEWYLFHGTNPEAAKAICSSDFKVSRAGSSTGTLYGKGLYFAESITKADEYAKPNEKGNYAVLMCRVIGGHVRYTDEITSDPEDLCYSCIEGPYDCVLGDREKTRGTYREFVLFDSEDFYPEYIIEYQRKYS